MPGEIITTTLTSSYEVQSEDDVYIARTGQIIMNSGGNHAIYDTGPVTNVTIVIDGSVIATSGNLLNPSAISLSSGGLNTTGGPDIRVGQTGIVQSLLSIGINVDGFECEVTNLGQIIGGTRGVDLEGNSGSIWNSGTIFGSSRGINFVGSDVVVINSGSIGSDLNGLTGATATSSAIRNTGTVAGATTGMQLDADDFTGNPVAIFDVTNGGTVSGGEVAIFVGSLLNHANGSQLLMTNSGTISGGLAGLRSEAGFEIDLTNAAGGTIEATIGSAIDAGDTLRLVNFGSIASASSTGIFLEAGSARSEIVNHGTISGYTGSINASQVVAGGTIFVTNHGTLQGVFTGASTTDAIRNHGLMDLVATGAGNDALTNSGTISGPVLTGAGNDLLDNRGGTIRQSVDLGIDSDILDNRGGTILGEIFGGLGADTFRLGAGIEVIDGGTDFDSVDFRGTPAVTVALDESLPNTGHAAGDEYTGIEGVLGSYFADLLVGSAGANTLRGYGGNDTLQGGAGSDKIVGGNGIDVLTGGAGSDVFVFDKLSETGDLITDFNAVNDALNIRASAFGGGLVAGVLAASQFQTRADNAAQDADDRFIFRTTDRTLWFDADGNGAGAAVLVADLQAGATVDRTDIILI